jgi:hypothetical protein
MKCGHFLNTENYFSQDKGWLVFFMFRLEGFLFWGPFYFSLILQFSYPAFLPHPPAPFSQ